MEEGLAVGHQALYPFAFGDGLVFVAFSVDADDLAIEILDLPVELDVLAAQSLSQISGKGLIPDD